MDQWAFSKFKGTDVIGPDNAQVGNGRLPDRRGAAADNSAGGALSRNDVSGSE